MRYSPEQLDAAFKSLPGAVQDAVLSTEVAEEIQTIGKEQGLHIDVMGALTEEITYVLVGLEKAADFRKNVETYVNVPADKLGTVVTAVNERVFTAVREAMKQQPQEEQGSESTGVPERAARAVPIAKPVESAQPTPEPTSTTSSEPQQPLEVSASAGQPTSDSAQPTQMNPRPAFVNKLKEKTATQTEVQEVGKGASAQNADQKKPGYRSTDPYREPIEEADLTKPTDAVQ